MHVLVFVNYLSVKVYDIDITRNLNYKTDNSWRSNWLHKKEPNYLEFIVFFEYINFHDEQKNPQKFRRRNECETIRRKLKISDKKHVDIAWCQVGISYCTRVTTYTCYIYCCHNTGIEIQDFKFIILNNSVTLTRYRPTPGWWSVKIETRRSTFMYFYVF